MSAAAATEAQTAAASDAAADAALIVPGHKQAAHHLCQHFVWAGKAGKCGWVVKGAAAHSRRARQQQQLNRPNTNGKHTDTSQQDTLTHSHSTHKHFALRQ